MDEPISEPQEASTEVPAEPVPASEPATEVPAAPIETASEQPRAESVSVESSFRNNPPPASSSPQSSFALSSHLTLPPLDPARGNAAKKQKVETHLEKILAQMRQKGKITNRDVVKLLRVSDATASRYLKMLVARGQLQMIGKGRSVVYAI